MKSETNPKTLAPGSAIPLALLAGTFAALASVFAKLTLDDRTVAIVTKGCLVVQKLVQVVHEDFAEILFSCDGTWRTGEKNTIKTTILRSVSFAAIFACNAAMWTTFTKALNRSSSSAKVTVVNSAMNFCATALLGNWLFDEPLSLQWYVGAALIVCGSVLVNSGEEKEEAKKKKS